MCFLVTIMAAPVGIGGGGILVPLFIYFGSFGAHAAIPLSKATMFGGAIANSILNLMRRHPFANRPLVDWVALQLVASVCVCVFVLCVCDVSVSVSVSVSVAVSMSVCVTLLPTDLLLTGWLSNFSCVYVCVCVCVGV